MNAAIKDASELNVRVWVCDPMDLAVQREILGGAPKALLHSSVNT